MTYEPKSFSMEDAMQAICTLRQSVLSRLRVRLNVA